MKTLSNIILSEIIVHNKYARYLRDKKRRETYDEIVDRVRDMHVKRYPQLKHTINGIFDKYVRTKKILPSMRSMQFAGVPIERNPSRIYNCAYMPAEHPDVFSETMFLLLGGCGVGYSVQTHHVASLPSVQSRMDDARRYVVGDSIEGWADSVKILVESFFYGKEKVRFDFDDIREKGTELVTSGGKAPGPGPLRTCLTELEAIFEQAKGRQLSSLEVHDIQCHIADAVLAGGIRRAAMIALFSPEDEEMVNCKSGSWREDNPQRGRANNSVVLLRNNTNHVTFEMIWDRVEKSGSGEPGIIWTNDLNWGVNPCAEIALKPYQFCNLTELNVSDIEDQKDLNDRAYAAGVLGTLQAGYTDFHYLRPVWRHTTEKDALIGVGLTGVASGRILKFNIEEAASYVNKANADTASAISINPASRTTTVKPSGTSSIVLGCSSGVHAWHSKFYVRRVRIGKDEALYRYLKDKLPALIEDDYFKPNSQAVISIPQEAPDGSIYRNEAVEDLFHRALRLNKEWVSGGHIKGENKNNVSCTLSVKADEWGKVGKLLWDNAYYYNGMSVLPYDGGTYVQAPFEEINEGEFHRLNALLNEVDLTEVIENEDKTDLTSEAACAGGVCEISV